MSLLEGASVCMHAYQLSVLTYFHVVQFREEQNKPDRFKQLALVLLCGIASHVVCLVNQLKCASAFYGSFPLCLHGVFFFLISEQVENQAHC